MTRWIVFYLGTPVRNDFGVYKPPIKAAMIDDDPADGAVSMPFGVSNEQVADDCDRILAVVEVIDPNSIPMIVIDDKEYSLDPADAAVDVEPVPPTGLA